jgi:hypothetical protein
MERMAFLQQVRRLNHHAQLGKQNLSVRTHISWYNWVLQDIMSVINLTFIFACMLVGIHEVLC